MNTRQHTNTASTHQRICVADCVGVLNCFLEGQKSILGFQKKGQFFWPSFGGPSTQTQRINTAISTSTSTLEKLSERKF
jgi:hypothetical protein